MGEIIQLNVTDIRKEEEIWVFDINDEDDKKFYEVAVTGEADYLITGNKKHYPKEKFRIIKVTKKITIEIIEEVVK